MAALTFMRIVEMKLAIMLDYNSFEHNVFVNGEAISSHRGVIVPINGQYNLGAQSLCFFNILVC